MKKVKLLTCVSAAGNCIATFLDCGKVCTVRAAGETAEVLMGLAPGTEVFVSASGDILTEVFTEEPQYGGEPAAVNEPPKAPENTEKSVAEDKEKNVVRECGKQRARISEALKECRAETDCETAMRRAAGRCAAVIEQYGNEKLLEEAADAVSLVRRAVDRNFAWSRLTVITAVLLMYAAESGRGDRKSVEGSVAEHCSALETANTALSMLLCMPYEPGLTVAFGEMVKVIYSPGTVETMNREASLFRSVMKEVGRWKE